jgi:oligogalacturonide lyase
MIHAFLADRVHLRLAGLIVAAVVLPSPAHTAAEEEEPPIEWIEPTTGHRVVRLSRDAGSSSLYFHQYAYSADGQKLIFTNGGGVWTVDLETRAVEQVVEGWVQTLLTGRKTGDVYYIRYPNRPDFGRFRPQGDTQPRRERGSGQDREVATDSQGRPGRRSARQLNRGFWRGGEVFAANLDTHEERRIAKIPDEFGGGNVAVNADETMLVAIGRDPDGTPKPRSVPSGPAEGRLIPGWSSGAPRVIYTIDIATSNVNVIHHSNDWLNHLQCSPTDPQQVLFCHEGPWHFVDRTWIIRTDGSGLTQVHPRTMDMEIAGHEFFSQDGKTVWYDLQTPRSLVFWLSGYEIATGKRTWYHHQRREWSVHYNISPDGKLFAGDGGGPGSVANRGPSGETLEPPQNGQWIYLFRPELARMTGLADQAARQVKAGMLRAERLVDMSQHDYDLEPNVSFTPDGKWIVFRSNMHGPTHVYAVEVARAD